MRDKHERGNKQLRFALQVAFGSAEPGYEAGAAKAEREGETEFAVEFELSASEKTVIYGKRLI